MYVAVYRIPRHAFIHCIKYTVLPTRYYINYTTYMYNNFLYDLYDIVCKSYIVLTLHNLYYRTHTKYLQ